jgi:ABC-type transport system involved in multi-copper enzyme maturation permease subunit
VLTVLKYALLETLHRRMAVILLIMGVVIVASVFLTISFETAEDGTLLVTPAVGMTMPAKRFVPTMIDGLLGFARSLWLFLVLFAVTPLLTTYMEKGWVELLVSKGVPRWQVVVERYAGGVVLLAISLVLVAGVPGVYFSLRAGLSLTNLFGALALLLLSFSAVLALMTLVSIFQVSPVIPIMVGFLQLMLSAVLANRQALYSIFQSEWIRTSFDWSYNILPKNSELSGLASGFLADGAIDSWWPVWSTGLFLVGALAVACWLFHRKSF